MVGHSGPMGGIAPFSYVVSEVGCHHAYWGRIEEMGKELCCFPCIHQLRCRSLLGLCWCLFEWENGFLFVECSLGDGILHVNIDNVHTHKAMDLSWGMFQ